MISRTVAIGSSVGLHARPASVLAEAVDDSGVEVTIAFDGEEADAASLLEIMTLGAKHGDVVTLSTEDDGAGAAAVPAETPMPCKTSCVAISSLLIEIAREQRDERVEHLARAVVLGGQGDNVAVLGTQRHDLEERRSVRLLAVKRNGDLDAGVIHGLGEDGSGACMKANRGTNCNGAGNHSHSFRMRACPS